MQSPAELDAFWSRPDPWGFRTHPDDQTRLVKLLAALPKSRYRRALDIGCGDGFIAEQLPAEFVTGIDLAQGAINQARDRTPAGAKRVFYQGSLFDFGNLIRGTYDLIIASGILYSQYLGGASVLAGQILAEQLAPGGDLVISGVSGWLSVVPPLTLLHRETYKYREFEHRLEIWRAC